MMVTLSMEQFCTTLGIYEPHEIEEPMYETLTYATASFWYSLLWRQYSDSKEAYVRSIAHASSLRSYTMRYLH